MTAYTKDIDAVVTTVQGKKTLRKYCRYIGKEYHEINVDCFKINGTWYRTKGDKIIYDYELYKWRLKSDAPFVRGVIDILPNNEYQYGHFTPLKGKNIDIMVGKSLYRIMTGIDISLIEKGSLIEGRNGVFYSAEIKDSFKKELDQYVNIGGRQASFYNISWDYSSEYNIPEFQNVFSNTKLKGKLYNNYYNYLKYTFGIEFETDNGAIPERYLRPMGLIPCRDGSIGGFEYVTVPLYQEKGIQAVHEHCKLLSYFCVINKYNSVHLHLGGYPRTKEHVVGLYRMLTFLQDDIYKLFPSAYRNTSLFKRRSYCEPLAYVPGSQDIDNSLSNIIARLGGRYDGTLPEGQHHPMDFTGEHKWQISPRYKIINLIPLIWGNRGTVEFRVHTPTIDFNKVIYWLFICSAILQYAEQKYMKFTVPTNNFQKSVSLSKIMKTVYPLDIANKIIDYIDVRTKYYANGNDPSGEHEVLDETKLRTLPVNNINPLIRVYE
jgi:hypothetical protein